jgi:hypothetical protein
MSDLPPGNNSNGYTYNSPPELTGSVMAAPYQETPVSPGQHNMVPVNGVACTFTAGSAAIAWTGAALAIGQLLTFATTGALPAVFAPATPYYVVSSAANTFQVSATLGGVAIISGSDAIAAAIVAGGTSGFAVGDTVTLTGGTFTAATVLKVTSVSAGGIITGVIVQTPGDYSTAPSNPVSMGSTSGAGVGTPTFTMTYPATSGSDTFTANSLTIPAGANYANLIASVAVARYTTDGVTTPSSTVGMPTTVGTPITLHGPLTLANFKIFGITTLVDVEYTK